MALYLYPLEFALQWFVVAGSRENTMSSERLDKIVFGLEGWDRISALWQAVGEATRQAGKADNTDEMLERLAWLEVVRSEHKRELETWKESKVSRNAGLDLILSLDTVKETTMKGSTWPRLKSRILHLGHSISYFLTTRKWAGDSLGTLQSEEALESTLLRFL